MGMNKFFDGIWSSKQSKTFMDHRPVENIIGFELHQKVNSILSYSIFDCCIQYNFTLIVKTKSNPKFLTFIGTLLHQNGFIVLSV